MNNIEFWSSEMFFSRLDAFLKARGWKISDIGNQTDITSQSLYALRKRNALPSLTTLCHICDAIGITLTEFFDVDSAQDADAIAVMLKVKSLPPTTVADLSKLVAHLT